MAYPLLPASFRISMYCRSDSLLFFIAVYRPPWTIIRGFLTCNPVRKEKRVGQWTDCTIDRIFKKFEIVQFSYSNSVKEHSKAGRNAKSPFRMQG
jgi:hypothetical protein